MELTDEADARLRMAELGTLTFIDPPPPKRREVPPLAESQILTPWPSTPLPQSWLDLLQILDYGFQPIVNTHTGVTFGQEALLANRDAAGFSATEDLFEAAFADRVLPEVEFALCDKAIAKFMAIPDRSNAKLFLNMDGRTLTSVASAAARVRYLARRHGMPENSIVIEISERHSLGTPAEMAQLMRNFRKHGFRLAIDDFGTGFSGLQMLYSSDSDLIKIDRFFINGIATDTKKRLFVSQILAVARLLGMLVVAEGMEAEQDCLTCMDAGCELVQGYLVQRPTSDLTALQSRYDHVASFGRKLQRRKDSDEWIIREQIEAIDPVVIDTALLKLFERFRANKNATFFPVVDATGVPLGIVRENDLKDYTYTHYGRSLIENKAIGRRLHQFLTKCPIAEINTDAEKILENFAADKVSEGIIIVEGMKYIGFLSADALLRVLNDKKIAAARDQSPLTKLPGNGAIHEFVAKALEDRVTPYVLCYMDFDNFKPFNDKYGFRVGDRAILMFAEMMRKSLSYEGAFIGHIGGDDFFFAAKGWRDFADTEATIKRLIDAFSEEARSLYDEETRQQGYVISTDRLGAVRQYPLLTVSAAIVDLPSGRGRHSADELSHLIARLKSEAKRLPERLCAATPVAVEGRAEAVEG